MSIIIPVSYTHLDVYKRQAYTTQLDPALKKGSAVSTSGAVGLDDEYYVVGTNASALIADKYQASGGVTVENHTKQGTNIEAELSGARDGSWVEVPLLYYDGYTAKDDKGNKLTVTDGSNHVARVELKDGSNTVKIKYSGKWYFKLGDIISLLTVLAMIVTYIFHKRSNSL